MSGPQEKEQKFPEKDQWGPEARPWLPQDRAQGWAGLTHICREGRLQARLALLALDGLDERSFLPADVSPSPSHHEHVKVIAGAAGILANQTSLVGLSDGHLWDKAVRALSPRAPKYYVHIGGRRDRFCESITKTRAKAPFGNEWRML